MTSVGVRTRNALRTLAAATALACALVACGRVAGAKISAQGPSATSGAAAAATAPSGDWMRFDYDAQRSGVGPADTGITAGDLSSLQTRQVRLSGVADSSAVELGGVSVDGHVRDVIFVTTTYGKTVAIDPATGTILWQFVPRDIASYAGSAQITTATPIIDPDRAYLYAASPDGRIHKLTVADGAEVRSGGWPARITFSAAREKIGTALNISGPWVIATTGGYDGDAPTYEGHVVVIDRASGRIAGVWNAECSNRHHLLDPPSSCRADTTFGGSAIWARAGAVVEPNGRLLVATGNGPFNGSTNWGDSVLELSSDAGRLLHNWTPRDQAQLNTNDTDLGSTAPALLGEIRGYRLAVQGGKDGMLHLLNLNRLDGTKQGAGPRLGGAVENVSSPGGGQVLTAPAVWSHDGRAYVFVGDNSGTAAYVLHVGRHVRLTTVWQNGDSGTSPVIAGGLLYVYDAQRGRLDVYAPASGRLLRSLPAAPGHWSSPIVIGGRIILPTGGSPSDNASQSSLFVYHLPGL
jgi:outer membrane protein assembly factor BamB